jgi:hypothetical protein
VFHYFNMKPWVIPRRDYLDLEPWWAIARLLLQQADAAAADADAATPAAAAPADADSKANVGVDGDGGRRGLLIRPTAATPAAVAHLRSLFNPRDLAGAVRTECPWCLVRAKTGSPAARAAAAAAADVGDGWQSHALLGADGTLCCPLMRALLARLPK